MTSDRIWLARFAGETVPSTGLDAILYEDFDELCQARAAEDTRIEAFADIVNRAGYASPIRTPRGRDILAACGQLKSESVKKRASEKRREALGVASPAE